MSDTVEILKEDWTRLLVSEGELKQRVAVLEAAAKNMIRAGRANAFIIPKDGERRDTAVAAWDQLKEAVGVRGSETP